MPVPAGIYPLDAFRVTLTRHNIDYLYPPAQKTYIPMLMILDDKPCLLIASGGYVDDIEPGYLLSRIVEIRDVKLRDICEENGRDIPCALFHPKNSTAPVNHPEEDGCTGAVADSDEAAISHIAGQFRPEVLIVRGRVPTC